MKASHHISLPDMSLPNSLFNSAANFFSLPILFGVFGRIKILNREKKTYYIYPEVTFSFLTVSHAFCPLPEIHALPPSRGST